MGLGAGVLISAVAFDLVQERFDESRWSGGIAIGLLVGSAVFFAGDVAIDRLGGGERRACSNIQAVSGLLVQATYSIGRLPTERKTST
jgi:zinc transporter, ZIP family